LTDPPVWQTGGQTGGQEDGRALAYTRYSIYAVARNEMVSEHYTATPKGAKFRTKKTEVY